MKKANWACAAFLSFLVSPVYAAPVQPDASASAVVPATTVSAPATQPVAKAAALSCDAPGELTRLDYALPRTALGLATGEPVTIVAVGSSSTAGAGATSPAMSYPARLEGDLRARFPGARIRVVNQGANGEDALQMLARFDAVIAEKPDLVLWQVGTNAVLRDHSLAGEAPLIREGIARLRAAQTDVVLIDSQYSPKVLAKPDANGMVELLRNSARAAGIGVA
ncbi:MAG: SGNH/GDSL hydrolase family protein, partial [Rhizobiales bacterium]|nr:SGNH/GDSL hydrolase family protein [Hyphomicrobiales bacterium]